MFDRPDRKCEENSDRIVRNFENVPLSCVVDAMLQLGLPDGALDPTIRHRAGPRIAGRARTMGRIGSPRNTDQNDLAPSLGMGLFAMVDSLSDGEVLVVASQGDYRYATFGDNLALKASMLGAVGVVTDAAIRDTIEIEALGFGAFSAGVSLRPGDAHFVTVTVDEPVVCGGILIRPGDIVLGDIEGVVVVRSQDAESVWKRAVEISDADQEKQESMRRGMSIVEATKRFTMG